MRMSDWHAGQNKAADRQTLTLTLPTIKPNVTIPVIELFLKG